MAVGAAMRIVTEQAITRGNRTMHEAVLPDVRLMAIMAECRNRLGELGQGPSALYQAFVTLPAITIRLVHNPLLDGRDLRRLVADSPGPPRRRRLSIERRNPVEEKRQHPVFLHGVATGQQCRQQQEQHAPSEFHPRRPRRVIWPWDRSGPSGFWKTPEPINVDLVAPVLV